MPTKKRQRLAPVLLACVASLVLGACSSIKTGTHYDETAAFGSYSTFAWIADDPFVGSGDDVTVDPLMLLKIRQTLRRQLEGLGYRFVEDRNAADFVVSFTVGSREKLRTSTYPVAYRGDWGWHVLGSRYYVNEYVEHVYTTGTLSVDIFDNRTRQPVWHGWAEKTITESDRRNPDKSIRIGVAQMFERFPR